MLQHTFCHLPGIGSKTEESLWRAGITTWDDFLRGGPKKSGYPSKRSWALLVEESREHFESRQANYFDARLPPKEKWRLFRDFRDSCAFLDIETTGLGSFGDHVTTIALYDGMHLRCYIHGINLEEFSEDVQKFKVLVTYNGTTFDLPFLRRQLGIALDHAHIDLRYVLHSLGFSGGLKRCEQQLGMERPGLQDVDGAAAVLLWREYCQTGNPAALETLLAYNVQDTINLQTLLLKAFERKVQKTPFASLQDMPEAMEVVNPYRADPLLLKKILHSLTWRLPFSG